MSIIFVFGIVEFSYAKNHRGKGLPPGLQKKMDRGQSLPPGWQKKLVVGKVLEKDIYDQGKIIATDSKGFVTISIQGRLVKLVEDTREIVGILSGM
jgi:hypothetical protein